MKHIIWIILLSASFNSFADDCEILKWKRNKISSQEFQYYGSVAPGSAKSIFVEVWDNEGMKGTGVNIINPRGRFSVTAFSEGKLRMKKSSKPVFSCSQDSFLNQGK